MSDTLKSPFKCGGSVVKFPNKIISGSLIIRIDNTTPTDKVLIKFNGTPAADNADCYLLGGESLEIDGDNVPNGEKVALLNVSGDPDIYWYLENI